MAAAVRPSRILVTVILVAGLTPATAHAYLDPGTGSLLLQGILGALFAVSTAIGLFRRRLQAFFRSKFGRPSPPVAEAKETETPSNE